jgi:hypothetical protein
LSSSGKIKSINEITGFEDKTFELQNQKQLKGINMKKFNLVHWVIFTGRNDILKFLLQNHFSKSPEIIADDHQLKK